MGKSKGIIVLDMPENCQWCPFIIKDMRLKTGLCAAWENLHDDMRIIPDGDKPDWCPVRELPENNILNELLEEIKKRKEIVKSIPTSEDEGYEFQDGEQTYNDGRLQGRYEELCSVEGLIKSYLKPQNWHLGGKIMGDCMKFPERPEDFIVQYKFKDRQEIYTNGSDLIPVFRVEQMLGHYMRELVAYKNTGLTPEEVERLKEKQSKKYTWMNIIARPVGQSIVATMELSKMIFALNVVRRSANKRGFKGEL